MYQLLFVIFPAFPPTKLVLCIIKVNPQVFLVTVLQIFYIYNFTYTLQNTLQWYKKVDCWMYTAFLLVYVTGNICPMEQCLWEVSHLLALLSPVLCLWNENREILPFSFPLLWMDFLIPVFLSLLYLWRTFWAVCFGVFYGWKWLCFVCLYFCGLPLSSP